ncbi:hypothetical protein QCA50_013173 [Cerrena zonata]|uniref:Extracellular membrane protein CFEM domain-containing protein n=1 Tax=Cerrena zonata TaxID=2478898 RepID=A0AAW0FUK2_9APHY
MVYISHPNVPAITTNFRNIESPVPNIVNMQFNTLIGLATTALAAIVDGAQLPPLVARQSTCSVSTGCNCLEGTADVPMIGSFSVDTCATMGQTCIPADSPIMGSVSTSAGVITFAIATGACN